MKKLFIIILLLSGTPRLAFAEKNERVKQTVSPDTLPVPNIPNLLFYIQRDPNANTICYQLNLDKKGNIDVKNPVHAFWIRYPEGGIVKELSFVQNKFAYGLKVTKIGEDEFELKSVALIDSPMYLKKDNKNKYQVFILVNQKQHVLKRVFVRINGGSKLSPNVLYVELKVMDPVTGRLLTERINNPGGKS